jgi:hypothetical protein
VNPDLEKQKASLLVTLNDSSADPIQLDELVHDLKSSEASDINNAGLEAQVEYIYEAMGDDAKNRILEAFQ